MTHSAQPNFDAIGNPECNFSKRTIIARSGARIDVSGNAWQIGIAETLNWKLMPLEDGTVLAAVRTYFRSFITRGSPKYVLNQYYKLKEFFAAVINADLDVNDATQYNMHLYEAARLQLRERFIADTTALILDAYRRWYLWCVDAGLEGFDEEVATVLENRIIGGNTKGAAVMRDDPHEGPLRAAELHQVTAHLRQATEERVLPISDLAVIWLFLAFGTNPKNLLLLNDEDLIRTNLSDGSVAYELRMPRIKKRSATLREGYRTRSLIPELGNLLEEIIADNSQWELGLTTDQHCFEKALLRRTSPKKSLVHTDFEPDGYRWSQGRFNAVLARFADMFNLRTIDGAPLSLTPRRLRYSFATRMVQEGASPYELADALDHTDLQQVMVYFNSRSDAVVALDKALNSQLTGTAQAFMGMVVLNEKDAMRGDDPASRVKMANVSVRKLDNVGTCGSFAFCGLAAPIACYTCFKFQPWLEAPHEEVLATLVKDRDERIRRGADLRMIQINDSTIEAVRRVVEICSERRVPPEAGHP